MIGENCPGHSHNSTIKALSGLYSHTANKKFIQQSYQAVGPKCLAKPQLNSNHFRFLIWVLILFKNHYSSLIIKFC